MTAQDARPSWINRHKALFALLALVAILLGAVGGWAVYLNQQLSNVPRIDLNLNEDQRPDKPTGSAAGAVNILIAGADAGDGPSIADNLEAGEWDPGSHRSDTIMILHVTADRDSAYLISVPRDSWVFIPGYGMNKVNAAFSFGGPSLYVETIEDLTGLRMDHLAIIDWNGFKSLTNALGGVEIYVPESGSRMLDGEDALRYVRTRYGLENGDFDRIKRQQNFMRAVMEKLLSQGTVSNPFKLTNALEAIASNLTVDDDFTNKAMRDLALSLRGIRSRDVTFVTAPLERLDRIDGQSVVILNDQKTKALFGAALTDDLDSYIDEHTTDLLGDPQSVD